MLSASLTGFIDISDSAALMHLYYHIAATRPGLLCNPSMLKINEGPYSQSISNIEDNRMKNDTSATIIRSNLTGKVQAFVSPNPFKEETFLQYYLPANSFVKVELIDETGSLIKIILNEQQVPGNYSIPVNCEGMDAGFYFIRLTLNNQIYNLKLILVK